MLLASIGDLILDVIVRLDGPLVPGDDRTAETRVGAGGQAANVAAWAASLGAEARFIGKRGADAAGGVAAPGLRGPGGGCGQTTVVVTVAESFEASGSGSAAATVAVRLSVSSPGSSVATRRTRSGLLRKTATLTIGPKTPSRVHALSTLSHVTCPRLTV